MPMKKDLRKKYIRYFKDAQQKLMWLEKNPEYEECPASFYEFCLSDEYLGLSNDIFESVLNVGAQVFDKNVLEVVILAGIGGGKSFLAQVLMCYEAHCILCLKDPHAYFKLSKDKPVVLMNMGLTAIQARKVVFSGVSALIRQSPWFMSKIVNPREHILSKSIHFFSRKKQIVKKGALPIELLTIESGNSSETTPIGMNLFMMVLDEAAFYYDSENRSQAQDIYDSAKARIQSRFGGRFGMIVVISSPRYEKDFISKKFAEGILYPDAVYSVKNPTWKMKDRTKLEKDCFVFDRVNYRILKKREYKEHIRISELSEAHKFHLRFGDDALNKRYWIIPYDYYDSFRRRPEKSIRDLGAEPTEAIEAFIKLREYIDDAMTIENRVGDNGVWDMTNPPAEPVFVHIDLALNKGGSGDAAGIAVCRCVGFDEKNDNAPRIKFEFVERITAGEGGEIKFADVRSRVLALRERGWKIGKVTLDNFQSFDTMQILTSKGIITDYQSVDTTAEPYEALRDALYDKRVQLPKMEFLKTELRELERVKGGKIDHPPTGSKDVADSVAGALYSCIKNVGIRSNVQVTRVRF